MKRALLIALFPASTGLAQVVGTEVAIHLRPVRAGAPEVSWIAARVEVRGAIDQTGGPFSMRIPVVHALRPGIADRVDSLVVRDASGIVPLRIETEPPDPRGYSYYRHWRAERRVVAPVVYTYHIRPQTRPGVPVYDFYAHDGGLSTSGIQMFVVPEDLGLVTARVTWDLTDLAPGSIAVGTWGEGDFTVKGEDYERRLMESYYMAGLLGHYAPSPNPLQFHGYWLGTPTYDPAIEAERAYGTYQILRRFYHDTVSSFRMFMRIGGGGGTSHYNSFMTGAARRAPGAAPTSGSLRTYTHEMGHYFLGWLNGGPTWERFYGDGWYGDGLNEHFTRVLMVRAGVMPVTEYASLINGYARGYYTNAVRNASNDSIQTLGYSAGIGGNSAQGLAYSKGSLFFSELDYRIRTASGGSRKLEDMVIPLLEQRRRGQPLSQDVLVNAIERELGKAGRDFFESAVTRGETFVPASGAFGPCLERQPATYTIDGVEFAGYTWVRNGVPDEQCRQW